MTLLYQKYVQVNGICPVCNGENEIVLLVLVTCPIAAQCWQMVFPEFQMGLSNDFAQWLTHAFNISTSDRRAEIVTLCWALWKARNDFVWNHKQAQVNVLVASTSQYPVQWKNAQGFSIKALFQHLVEGDGAEKWVKTQVDSIKVTFDTATFNEQDAFGKSVIARDHNGELIREKTRYKQGRVATEFAEVMAIKEALSMINDQGWQSIVLESDSFVAIQVIRSNIPMVSPFGHVMEECREVIRSLNKFSLFFIKRSVNITVHQLGRESCSFLDRVFDRRDVPIDVKNALMFDSSQ